MSAPKGWLGRLGAGLSRSSEKLRGSIGAIFSGRSLDADTAKELEEVLITADLGPATAARLVADLSAAGLAPDAGPGVVAEALARNIAAILAPLARPLEIDPAAKPHVVLVVGVNGTGKTTTVGKLAHQFAAEGHKVAIAAADTFRAAAVEQLRIWAERANAEFFGAEQGADAAAVAYTALERTRQGGTDVLLVDTAGRLHNKANLMDELEKIGRVMKKLDPAAPHSTILVLDASTGQNAHAQADTFRDIIDVTGLVVTKFDGSARGGVLVSLADRQALPIHAIGVGESIEDLRPFAAEDFARALVGIEGRSD
jgi:fused signal recognition particle receptor